MPSAGITAWVQRGFLALRTNDNRGVARTDRGRGRPQQHAGEFKRQVESGINDTDWR